jgi:hypothetical protein
VRAAIITPVESSAAYLARFTDDSDLPRYSGGSAPTLALSRPSQCSLTLRPARSADPLRGLSIEVLQIIRRLLIRSDRFRLEREFAGPDFHRGERCALPRHTEQSGREFASACAAAGAQDAALQERRLRAEIPLGSRRRVQHFQRPTPSHVSSITPRAPRRGNEHVARGRRGRMKVHILIARSRSSRGNVTMPAAGLAHGGRRIHEPVYERDLQPFESGRLPAGDRTERPRR